MVSIIVPVYNTGMAVKRCVDSLLHQSYQDIEIILVDDGSDRETASICDRLRQENEKLTVFHCQNRGVSAARNYGMERAVGKYIFFADADDYAEPRMLEVMVDTAEKYHAQLIVTGYYFDTPYTSDDKQVYESIELKVPSCKIATKDELKEEMVYLWDASLMYNIWNKLFELKIIKENHICFPIGKTFNEDRDFVRKYLCHIQSAYVLGDCFYHYMRENETGATNAYRSDMLAIRKEEFHRLKKFFESLGIYNARSREYVAREHFDRVVATVENIFHGHMQAGDIRREIRKVIKDDDTRYAMKYTRPRSKKMQVLYLVFKTHNTVIIFAVMKAVYLLRRRNPALFYRLRQSR